MASGHPIKRFLFHRKGKGDTKKIAPEAVVAITGIEARLPDFWAQSPNLYLQTFLCLLHQSLSAWILNESLPTRPIENPLPWVQRSIWKCLGFKGNNRLKSTLSGVGYKAEKTNRREARTALRESLQQPQVISSTSKPHSANPMWSLWIPQEPSLLPPEDLSISVSSDVGGGRVCSSYDSRTLSALSGEQHPTKRGWGDRRMLGTQSGKCGWRLRGSPSARSSGVPTPCPKGPMA